MLRLQTKVMLQPVQQDATVYANVKENLRAALLGKCVEAGCITDIIDMTLLDGEYRAENFSGAADVEVAYSAKVCNPQADQHIVCELVKVGKPVLVAKNGPIRAVTRFENISSTNFNIVNDDIIYKGVGPSNNRTIVPGDFVKLKVYRSKYSQSGDHILVLGIIEDLASAADIALYQRDTGAEGKMTSTLVTASDINKDIMTPGVDFEELTVNVGTGS